MSSLNNPNLKLQWQGQLDEYITALCWSQDGTLAISSAGGEVTLFSKQLQQILKSNRKKNSILCLDFSADDQFLAAGGEDGELKIWQFPQRQSFNILYDNSKWIENLAWHPQENYLAFTQGRNVLIWDAVSQKIIATLPFKNSFVLDLAWNPNGELLAIAGNGGVKIWDCHNWQDDPFYLEMNAAALKISWSSDGEYLAVSSLDKIVLVWGGGNLVPWRLLGFSSKIRNLSWSPISSGEPPILATSCMGDIILWKRTKNEDRAWNASVLKHNNSIIHGLQFHPQNFLLASGNEEGSLLLWKNNQNLAQNFPKISESFSCLKWDLSGQKLALGSKNGKIMIFQLEDQNLT
ncbi:eIF2A-related protein [Geminocystis sp. GBBB08]|uniref:WD40 repeat domain-containing protein n=1 Tax=Geminocystis sp. GBBB08 TaxID=2604140 RepID=UPI0027E27BDE|nr:hypothetical protein [Geminocystis sp. GBBB08]MBL1208432.1 hypothetical protein [Geminocystis sp. GBBB08]